MTKYGLQFSKSLHDVKRNLEEGTRVSSSSLDNSLGSLVENKLPIKTQTQWRKAEVYEQMYRSGGQSEVKPQVFKSPNKLGTHLSTHCSREERLGRPCPARE
ncbi:hypothetical protein TNCV_4655981 [Trichonephila clavipes]|nr:hypothetical protein TNCV_4655981 [Trichonephila clavipes]